MLSPPKGITYYLVRCVVILGMEVKRERAKEGEKSQLTVFESEVLCERRTLAENLGILHSTVISYLLELRNVSLLNAKHARHGPVGGRKRKVRICKN